MKIIKDIFDKYQNLILKENEIQILIFNTNEYLLFLEEAYTSILSSEKMKANFYHFDKDVSRYIFTRFLTRLLLSRYLNIPGQDIEFINNDFGKPYILPLQNSYKINFSISHSGDLIVLAFISDQLIGIDIELIKPIFTQEFDKNMIFTTQEQIYLDACHSESELNSLFYKLWTCKEAVSKAIGKGLLIKLNIIEVEKKFSTVAIKNSEYKNTDFFIKNIRYLPDTYIGHLAVSKDNNNLIIL